MVLAPHAGLIFSGQIAAEAFRQLEPGFERVVIIAGNHTAGADYAGLSVDRSTAYRVPGLEVPVARAAAALLQRPGFVDEPSAHTQHMVEIELPFLAAVNGRPFELVPLIAGRMGPDQLRAAAAELAKLATPSTRFIFSVDLSHYHPYERAVALDRSCLEALSLSDAQAISACDTDATQVLLLMNELSARLALTPLLLGYANSGDVQGDRARVVGYAAMAYQDRFELSRPEGEELLKLARRALISQVRQSQRLPLPPELTARFPRLATPRAAFVTLTQGGQLRGCIGSLLPGEALAEDVLRNAINAATADPRFSPVRPEELQELSLSISVLELPKPLPPLTPELLLERLSATRPGLILEAGGRRSTFLPEVWEQLPQAPLFLGQLCRKQGAPEHCWKEPSAKLQAYGAQHLAESH